MLGVDRLDMIKGIPQKLLAFEKFLDEHPDYRHSVVLIQIAVPSRLDVPEYQNLRSQVHEIVGRINGARLHRCCTTEEHMKLMK
jgi:trehalose 6-phosphate synthase/phosphatase